MRFKERALAVLALWLLLVVLAFFYNLGHGKQTVTVTVTSCDPSTQVCSTPQP